MTFQGSSDNGANEKEIVYAREFLTDKLSAKNDD